MAFVSSTPRFGEQWTRIAILAIASCLSSARLAEHSAAGDVVMCQLTRYECSKTIEAWQCRVSGYVPAQDPGRKPKAA